MFRPNLSLIAMQRNRVRNSVAVLFIASASTFSVAQPTATAAQETIYIKAGHLFDATGDKLRDNVVLVVEGERISKVAPASEVTIPGEGKTRRSIQ